MSRLRPALLRPALALLAAASAALPALALQPLVTDDTGTQGAGGQQLELSWSRGRLHTGAGRTAVHTLAPTYTYGLAEALDAYASLPYQSLRGDGSRARGWGNAVLGAKWRFCESPARRTSLALKPELLLPVSPAREAAGLGAGKVSAQLTAILSQEMPFGALHANLGWGRERSHNAADQATLRRVSIAPVWSLSSTFQLVADLGLESRQADGNGVRTHFVELGAIYSPGPDLDFAVGALRTQDNAAPRSQGTTLTAGVTWRF
ncbi:transporter [Comamonas granuli]|uniref:transporter n=1 Tax=Comamonas granuli TaxID=290309 RepID=UPI000693CBEC|nr:transporter [Comamonas granuli]